MHRWSNRTQWFIVPCGLIRERPMRQAFGCPNANPVEAHQSSFVCYELRFGICQVDLFRRIDLSTSSSTSSASSSPRYHNPTVPGLLPSVAMRVDAPALRSWSIYCTLNNSGIVPKMFRSRAIIFRRLQNVPWLGSLDVLIYSFIHFLMAQQLHHGRAMATSQNRDTMSKPGRKGR